MCRHRMAHCYIGGWARISEETIAIILRKLGEAGIPISAPQSPGDMDGASFFKWIPAVALHEPMMSMMQGQWWEVIEPTGWEAYLTVWDSAERPARREWLRPRVPVPRWSTTGWVEYQRSTR